MCENFLIRYTNEVIQLMYKVNRQNRVCGNIFIILIIKAWYDALLFLVLSNLLLLSQCHYLQLFLDDVRIKNFTSCFKGIFVHMLHLCKQIENLLDESNVLLFTDGKHKISFQRKSFWLSSSNDSK